MNLTTEEGIFKGYDDSELYYQTWPKDHKALLVGIHGLGEHSGSYRYLVDGLKDSPYQLVMADLRGHGRSSGKRAVGTIDQYILDTKLFLEEIKKHFPQVPFFFLGHSMGGLILTKFLIRNGNLGALGAVFSSPFYGVAMKVPAIKAKAAGILASLTPRLTLSNEIVLSDLTHDPGCVEFHENDHWRHDRISAQLYMEMMKSIDYVFENHDQLQLPVLYQIAGADKVVSSKRTQEYFELLTCEDKTKYVYEGFYHEIYNEKERSKPIGDLIQWLDKRVV